MCTVAVAVPVVVDWWWLMMALRRDLMIHQGDCGQAKSASSRASVVPSAHVKWLGDEVVEERDVLLFAKVVMIREAKTMMAG